jgi:hypothetical protein
MVADPAIPMLRALLANGSARVPEGLGLRGPEHHRIWEVVHGGPSG